MAYPLWLTPYGLPTMAYTLWLTPYGFHPMAFTLWLSPCGFHPLAYTLWLTLLNKPILMATLQNDYKLNWSHGTHTNEAFLPYC